MKYAFVFPGQGSQYVGMGISLAAAVPEARAVLKRADEVLGRPLSKLMENGPEPELTLTWNAQPAILTVSVACLEALRARTGLAPVAVAGHSLGEYSALVAAGAMTFEDAVATVEKRGRYMQEAVPVGVGAMYAILGLDAEEVQEICAAESAPGRVVGIANDNCPGQVVVSGHVEAAERVAGLAKEKGAKRAVLLNVSAPFHSSLMEPAAKKLAVDLGRIVFADPSVPVVANVDARPVREGGKFAALLSAQVASRVRWTDSVKTLKELGAEGLLEIGPGKVLSGLTKRIDRDLESAGIENEATLDAFAETLK